MRLMSRIEDSDEPHRRTFLRAAGVSLALPLSRRARRRPRAPVRPARSRSAAWCASTRRWACTRPIFFPEKAGKDYALSPYLEVLKDFRNDFTVISGLSHPDVGPSHDSNLQLPDRAPRTRSDGPASATASRSTSSRPSTSTARRGSPACRCRARASACPGPAAARRCRRTLGPSSVFAKLFLEGRPDEVAGPGAPPAQTARASSTRCATRPEDCRPASAPATATSSTSTSPASASWSSGWSQAEAVVEEAQAEGRRQAAAEHPRTRPTSIGKTRLLFDLIHLALQTDSTRLITLQLLGTSSVPPIPGVTLGHHDLSHHGKDPAKIAQLKTLETREDEDPARLPRAS